MVLLKPEIFPFQAKFNESEKFLRVAITPFNPFINRRRIRDFVEVHGAFSQAAVAIEAITKHKLSVVSVDESPFGYKLANGTFMGIMGKFQRGEIDIFMGPVLFNEERFPLAEPSTISISTFTLLTWSPEKIVNPFNFALAFSGVVWTSILVSFLLLVLISWILDRFLTPWRKDRKLPLTFYLWEFFTYFFPQCSNTQKAGWFKMCQMSFWISFSLILMNFLSGALTSSMTIKDEEDYVNKYVDVLRFPRVRIFAEAQSALVQMFTDPKNKLYRELKTRLSPVRGMFKRGETVLHIVSETEAKRSVVVSSPTLCKAMILAKKEASGKCPNVMISTESAGVMVGFVAMSRRLPKSLRFLINKGVTTSTEASLHQQYMTWTMREAEKCLRPSSQDDAEIEPLSILDVQGCFVLWSLGIPVACFCFLIERLSTRWIAQ